MISIKELNPKNFPMDELTFSNITHLHKVMNEIRTAYGKPMFITSGLRSMEDHLHIYKEKGITDKSKIPMSSKHLYGQACDVGDTTGDFWNWCMKNIPLMEKLGIYFEDRAATPTWVHCQTISPKSGNRIFKP